MEKFEDLLGKTITDIKNIDNYELIFTLENGEKYKLYHEQDCCEIVMIEDICGDLNDLMGSPILLAENVVSNQDPPDAPERSYYNECFTWSFYKLSTIKGSATIRWYGTSNGYYSESVDFGRVEE